MAWLSRPSPAPLLTRMTVHSRQPGRSVFSAWRRGLDDFRPQSQVVVADWIGKFACVAAGIGIALVPQLVTRAMPAGVTVLKLRNDQAPYRRVVAVTRPRQQPSELTAMFIRLVKRTARQSSPVGTRR